MNIQSMTAGANPAAGAVCPSAPDIAAQLIANGYRPVPCIGKTVKIPEWPKRAFTEADFGTNHNVGIKTGQGVALIDIDVTDQAISEAIQAEWTRRHPGAPQRTGKAPKTAFLVASDVEKKIDLKLPKVGKDDKIEVLANGQQFVAYGIHPDTKAPYHWHGLDPLDQFLGGKEDLPVVSEIEIKEFVQWVAATYAAPAKPKLSERAAAAGGFKIDTGDGNEFWRNVNTAALASLGAWVPALIPAAKRNAAGAFRITSRQLGRELQEDLSIHPDGIQDFGVETKLSPIDLVKRELGGEIKEAALWLCDKMNVAPKALGFNTPADTEAEILRALQDIKTRDRNTETPPKEDKPKRRFRLIRSDRLEFSEPDWLVKGLFEAETLSLIFGDPGCGKSFVAFDLAASIATGRPFHGHEVKRGAVIYICGEGHNGIKRRLIAWEKYNETTLENKPLYISEVPGQFLNPESVGEIVAAIDEAADEANMPIALIVVDTLNRNMGAGDESNTKDMTMFVAAVDAARGRYKAAAQIVHHTGHGNKDRARGSYSLHGALDHEYRLEKIDQSIVMTNTKMKDSAAPAPLGFKLCEIVVAYNRIGEAITSAALEAIEAPRIDKQMRKSWTHALTTLADAKRRAGHGEDLSEAVTLEQWRETFYEKSTGTTVDSKRAQFSAVRKALVEAGLVAVTSDNYRFAKVIPGVT